MEEGLDFLVQCFGLLTQPVCSYHVWHGLHRESIFSISKMASARSNMGQMANAITVLYGRGFSRSNVAGMRQFYMAYRAREDEIIQLRIG